MIHRLGVCSNRLDGNAQLLRHTARTCGCRERQCRYLSGCIIFEHIPTNFFLPFFFFFLAPLPAHSVARALAFTYIPCSGGGGGGGGRWGVYGGLAPADSEVRNLHLITVCQPMIWLCRPESLSTPLCLSLPPCVCRAVWNVAGLSKKRKEKKTLTTQPHAKADCADIMPSRETTLIVAGKHTSHISSSSFWCFSLRA